MADDFFPLAEQAYLAEIAGLRSARPTLIILQRRAAHTAVTLQGAGDLGVVERAALAHLDMLTMLIDVIDSAVEDAHDLIRRARLEAGKV